jgi:hypothetical protein
MRFRFHDEMPATSRLLAWACLAAACFPGIAAATDTATPSQPYLAFNPAEVSISPTAAQQLTASFAVTGSDTPTAALHYGHDYTAGAVNCTPSGAGQTCTVPVSFIPTLPGVRKDALFLMDGTAIIATVYLGGVGQAPLALVQPGVVSTTVVSSGLNQYDSAIDENGTAYIVSTYGPSGGNVYSVTGEGVASIVPVTVTEPAGIAIDGAGILYISQNANSPYLITWNTVTQTQGFVQLTPNSYCSKFEYLTDVAVDAKGDLFTMEYECAQVFELVSGGSLLTTSIGSISFPEQLAVDGAGDIFLSGSSAIHEIPFGGVLTEINTVGVGTSTGLAADAADSLYATRYPGGGVAELPAASYAASQASLDPTASPTGLGLGSNGMLYVGNYLNLDKVDRSQGAINFGLQTTVGVASAPQIVQIYNGGNQPLTISNIALTGSASGFAIEQAAGSNCAVGTVVVPGGYCEIEAVLTPVHVGTVTGSIAVTTNSLYQPATVSNIALSGYMSGAWIVATPNPLAFGNQQLNTPVVMGETLTNTGYIYSATVPAPSSNNGAFTAGLGNCPASLAVGASCQLSITFDPTLSQNYNGTISFTSVGNGVNQAVSFAVTGIGGVPNASLSPNPVVFPNQNINSTSTPMAVTVTNTGTAPLTGIQANITGANAAEFDPGNGPNACSGSLAAGSMCNIYVTFTPLAGTNYSATLSVADNAPGQPQTVVLTGIGIATQNLAINEVIHTTDAPVPNPATMLNIGEVIHTTDAPVLAGTPTLLQLTQQPSSGAVGSPIGNVAVQVEDASGNLVSGSTAAVTMASSPAGVAGTLTVNAIGGIATFTNLVFNAVNSYKLTASASGLTSATGSAIQITKGSQTIAFASLPNQPIVALPFAVSATATSGLPVSFASATKPICTVSGNIVTLVAVGQCSIHASQAGNTNYLPATPVTQSFQVTKASQSIAFGPLSNQPFGTPPFGVAATASSGLPVAFASTTTTICTVSGDAVTLVAIGHCTIRATQAGNADYTAATPVSQSFQVTKGSQTITFGALSNKPLGTAPFTVTATASSGLPVTFASTTTAICTVSGNTVTLVAVGRCTIHATQTGDADYAAATPVNQSFQVIN